MFISTFGFNWSSTILCWNSVARKMFNFIKLFASDLRTVPMRGKWNSWKTFSWSLYIAIENCSRSEVSTSSFTSTVFSVQALQKIHFLSESFKINQYLKPLGLMNGLSRWTPESRLSARFLQIVEDSGDKNFGWISWKNK